MIEVVINGWGRVTSFTNFVDYCMWKQRQGTEPLDRVVMNALFTYYPSLYTAMTDSHGGLEKHPMLYMPGSKQAYLSLDRVFAYLDERWQS